MSGRCWHPDNARKIGTFELNVAFENWFKMVLKSDTYKLITSKTCVHFYHIFYFSLWDSEREFFGSVALNILTTVDNA